MKFVADFHIHSKYSRATSPQMDLEHLNAAAKIKGIKVLGTADFSHPEWFKSLKEKLEPAEIGLFKLKKQDNGTRFVLTNEISCVYSKKGRVRKIHILIFAPSLEVVEKINAQLGWVGNLKSDGRPILGLDAKELAKIVLSASEDCLVVPAHAWTPWFSIFGSKSGFDSIEECFEEYSKYIYAVETGLSCYDQKTEVLTQEGWKPFSQVTYKDSICTLDPETEEIEYQKPRKIYQSQYRGKMYRLKTKRVDLLVTPNHNLLYAPADFRTKKPYRLKEAQELFGKSKILRKDGIWKGKTPRFFTLPEVQIRHGSKWYSGLRTKSAKKLPIEAWAKFFGYWIAEGWTNEGKDGDYNICIAVQKPKARQAVLKIIEELGYSPYFDEKIIRIRNYQLFSYLRQFGRAGVKFVPHEIKELSPELLKAFLEYYLWGDGHVYGRNKKGRSATTISTRLRDDLQEIALKTGDSAYYKLGNKKGTPFASPSQKKQYYQSADSWVIYFIRHNRTAIIPSTIKKYGYEERWVDYDGIVYCVSVPNRTLYIRRNGIPLWCGNSDPPMNWRLSPLDKITLISNSDAHSGPKLGREANVFDAELSYKSIIEAIKTKNPQKFLYTIEFFPEEGKYHFDGHRICGIKLSPQETKKYNGICPVCGKTLTIGVLNRVEELADREEGFKPEGAIPFKSLVPLEEIIADALGCSTGTKEVEKEYKNLIEKLGSEFNVLLEATPENLRVVTLPEISEAIIKVREGRVFKEPGYDGVYGKIRIFSQGEQKNLSKQDTLF